MLENFCSSEMRVEVTWTKDFAAKLDGKELSWTETHRSLVVVDKELVLDKEKETELINEAKQFGKKIFIGIEPNDSDTDLDLISNIKNEKCGEVLLIKINLDSAEFI